MSQEHNDYHWRDESPSTVRYIGVCDAQSEFARFAPTSEKLVKARARSKMLPFVC